MTYTEIYEHVYSNSEGIQERINALDLPSFRAFTVLRNLNDRGGFDHWFDALDSELQDEIFDEMRDAIASEPQ